MAENKMAEVAKLLGVELNEEFHVRDQDGEIFGYKYKITQKGLCFWVSYSKKWIDSSNLEALLFGTYSIEKIPFVPKNEEGYYTYAGRSFKISHYTWCGDAWEYGIYRAGMVFRTRAEAVAARPNVYKELTGKDWEGDE